MAHRRSHAAAQAVILALAALLLSSGVAAAQPAVLPAPTSPIPSTAATRPAPLTFDLTTKAARALQASLDSRLPLGTDSPMRWRDKPRPGEKARPEPGNTTLKVEFATLPSSTDGADRLPGLVVFISPSDGAMLPEFYLPALARRGLLAASPLEAGNGRSANWRLFAAVAAVQLVRERTALDPGRIYISGMSGGGRMSCIAGQACPETFAGVLALCGPAHFRNVSSGRGGEAYPGFAPHLPRALLDAARAHPFVLVTGNRDFNREPTLRTEAAMREDGFTAVSSLVCADLGHALPRVPDFEAALETLDDPALRAAGELFQEALDFEKRNKPGEALLRFHQAYSRNPALAPQAEANYRRLRAVRDAEKAAAEAAPEPTRPAALKRFATRWDPKPAVRPLR